MTTPWLNILHPDVSARSGRVRHVLFDFDGTLSVLREGWETVMIPLMVESIHPGAPAPAEIEREVTAYVDESTGILTIRQMEWLADTVRRYGLNPNPLSAAQYKAIYRQRLLERIGERLAGLEAGRIAPDTCLLAGARSVLTALVEKGATLYLASGTDHSDVVREARSLGVDSFFDGRIYGALDASESHDKERLVERILSENQLHGSELAVLGDGPVEIRVGAMHSAISIGVASDEQARQGWNPRKVERLASAGADALVADFTQAQALADWLVGSAAPGR